MKTVAGHATELLDWAVAQRALPGQAVCGDLHLVRPVAHGVLLAAVDGLGHGEEAASAAQVAVATLHAHAHESIVSLLERCHAALRATRGAALTLATLNAQNGTMSWVGVGSVAGVLLRADARTAPPREYAFLYGGVVGLQLPPLRDFVLSVAPGDTLLLATDGIHTGFADGVRHEETLQAMADRILARSAKDTDDALVLVARYLGV